VASSNERKRILDLLAAGRINVEQATALLKALGPTPAESLPLPPRRPAEPALPPHPGLPHPAEVPAPPAPSQSAFVRRSPRFVRIKVDATKEGGKSTNVDVRIPYALAKFALRFLPQEARRELEAQGIDISQLLETAETMPEGKIVDVDAVDPDGESTAHITVEVL
jgi:hypothetical protein